MSAVAFISDPENGRYVEKSWARLGTVGITDIEVRSVGVQGDLSSVTRATLA